VHFFKENPFCRDSVDLPIKTNRAQRYDHEIYERQYLFTRYEYRYLNKKWRYSTICCIETILKSLFIAFLTLHVTLYFCKAINVENKWKGKPSLLRVLFVLFKVGEKMQNIRMLTRIYHLSAVLSTALVSSAFTTSWSPKKIRLNGNRAACLSIQAFPSNLACNKERGAGVGKGGLGFKRGPSPATPESWLTGYPITLLRL